jgi:hypothetical protein
MKNRSPCVVVPFARSGNPQPDALLVFPDLCGRALELTPALKQAMAIAFADFGMDVDNIKTHSQLFAAGQYTMRNPLAFSPTMN